MEKHYSITILTKSIDHVAVRKASLPDAMEVMVDNSFTWFAG
jgi:hypothetical protein